VTHSSECIARPAEAKAFLDAVVNDAEYHSGFNFIGDLRNATNLGHTFLVGFAKEVRERAAILAPCRWAMATSDKAGVTVVHLLNVLAFGTWIEFGACRTLEEAVQWVDAGTAEWLALDDLR